VTIHYFTPALGLKKPDVGMTDSNLVINKSKVYEECGWSKLAVESWRKLYKEKKTARDVFMFFIKNYPAEGNNAIYKLQKEARELKNLATWEELENGLPELY